MSALEERPVCVSHRTKLEVPRPGTPKRCVRSAIGVLWGPWRDARYSACNARNGSTPEARIAGAYNAPSPHTEMTTTAPT